MRLFQLICEATSPGRTIVQRFGGGDAFAAQLIGLVGDRVDVPGGLVVGEDAGLDAAARPHQPRQGRRRVVDVVVAQAAVFVAVDRVAVPLRPVEAERPFGAQLLLAHPAAEVRLQPGDRRQRPDPALAEFVATGGGLEGAHVLLPGSASSSRPPGCT